MFEQTFKNIDDILHKDAGASSELDYVEQTSWILFLKYLDELEQDKSNRSRACLVRPTILLLIRSYQLGMFGQRLKTEDGKLDHHKAMTGDDLKDFVNHKLFPYLKRLQDSAPTAPNTIEYKIGEIFSEMKNKIQSGYNLREVINLH